MGSLQKSASAGAGVQPKHRLRVFLVEDLPVVRNRVIESLQETPRLLKIIYSNHVSANIRKLASQFGAAYFFDKTLDTPKLRMLLEGLSTAAD